MHTGTIPGYNDNDHFVVGTVKQLNKLTAFAVVEDRIKLSQRDKHLALLGYDYFANNTADISPIDNLTIEATVLIEYKQAVGELPFY